MMMIRFKAGALGAAILAASALAPNIASADWPEEDITLIIPSSAGGGFDTYARVLGRAMEKHLPEGIKVVPRNISGAGGMRGASAAFNAEPDGHTFATFNVPGIIMPVIQGEAVDYDLDEIEWLGAMAFNQYILAVEKDSPINTLDDVKAKDDLAFTGYGSSGVAANRIICAEMNLEECTIITGYPGNNEAMLAVIRGDADATISIISSLAAFDANNELRGVVQFTTEPDTKYPDVPTTVEAGYPELANLGLIRAFGAPPGIPEETLSQLREAFESALADPEVAEWARSTDSPFTPMGAERLKKLISDQTALLRRYKDVLAGQ